MTDAQVWQQVAERIDDAPHGTIFNHLYDVCRDARAPASVFVRLFGSIFEPGQSCKQITMTPDEWVLFCLLMGERVR